MRLMTDRVRHTCCSSSIYWSSLPPHLRALRSHPIYTLLWVAFWVIHTVRSPCYAWQVVSESRDTIKENLLTVTNKSTEPCSIRMSNERSCSTHPLRFLYLLISFATTFMNVTLAPVLCGALVRVEVVQRIHIDENKVFTTHHVR